ncbi:MAG: lipid-A-disaccharide synthase, partial [Saprospiraceae bacterium]|nr:lipid-A-disaccharide synthase [Saprospiraceae bacterium]
MKLFILAGEASGDLHAGNLVKALSRHTSDLEVRAWGGEKLEDAGAQVLKHYKELAIIGFVEVLKKLPTIFKNFKTATKQVLEFQPDAVVLVDFSGFNLRWAKKLRKAGYKGKIFYYISPKL